MMKRMAVFLFMTVGTLAFSMPTNSGATGMIDFPDAYNLRTNNYTISVGATGIDKDTAFNLMLEGGFLPQFEAGISMSSKNTAMNENLLKSNIKFQFVQEADNPALALGLIENRNTYNTNDVYAYLAISKRFKEIFGKNSYLELNGGLKYDKDKNMDGYFGIGLPIFEMIKIVAEGYSYKKYEYDVDNKIKNKKTNISFNLGGEFITTDTIRTKVYYSDIDNTVGLSLTYISIYK